MPFSTTDVKKVVNTCPICAEIKPQFHRGVNNTLIKVTHPMEKLSIDFKGPLPSSSNNKYLFFIIDEYSRFPFAFLCKEMTSSVVINCFDKLFTLCGTPCFVHSDNGPAFVSSEFRRYLLTRGIASSKSSIYHPSGNGQVKKCVGTVWKALKLCLKTLKLPISRWELVLDNALHAICSLLCVATNVMPHKRFFSYQRRSCVGDSLPSWLTNSRKAYVKRFVRLSKNDPFVNEVELIHTNPTYANVRYCNGGEATVSIRDLVPNPQSAVHNALQSNEIHKNKSHEYADNAELSEVSCDNKSTINDTVQLPDKESTINDIVNSPAHKINVGPRRSARNSKGVPPPRYGIDQK